MLLLVSSPRVRASSRRSCSFCDCSRIFGLNFFKYSSVAYFSFCLFFFLFILIKVSVSTIIICYKLFSRSFFCLLFNYGLNMLEAISSSPLDMDLLVLLIKTEFLSKFIVAFLLRAIMSISLGSYSFIFLGCRFLDANSFCFNAS